MLGFSKWVHHFLQGSCAQLSSTKPLGRCFIPVHSLFSCSSLCTPQMKPLTTQARNTFLSSSQGPIVSIFPYLPTHPTWPPIQLPSIVNSSTSESVASRLAPHVWDVVQITVWGGSLVTLSLSVYFNSF